MEYVLMAILGLIMLNRVFTLPKLRKCNREEIGRLENPERLNIRR